ncbi:MAG: Fic family protein [Candidatus Methanoplasma sp.]|jgi:prophage maintenance system killer protein|nr:Fic family protein [Candidatus Methanoplasma sp.]
MVSRISVEFIKEVHGLAILSGKNDESDLVGLVRDEATLFFIADRSNTIVDKVKRASFLLFSIANYHPFVDGNKRTAVLVAELVLGQDLSIKATAEELNIAVRKIGSPDGNLEYTEKWLEDNIEKIC